MFKPFAVASMMTLAAGSGMAATIGGGGDARALDLSQKFDLAAAPDVAAATYVATQAEGKLKGIKRVAITNMCVQFVNAKSAAGQSRGGTRTYTRSSDGGIPGGLDLEKMQAVADAWYEQIEVDLKAQGVELVPYEELAANDQFKKFAEKYETGVRQGVRSVDVGKGAAADESVVYVSPKGRPFAPDCGTISPASTGTFVRMAYPLNAEFLTVSAVVDMGQAKATGGLLKGASADIQYGQFLRAGDSQFQFVGKTGPGARIWLKQSIVPQQDPFAVGSSQQGERTGSVDAASGTVTLNSSSTQAVAFNEDLYYKNAADHLNAMHRMFLQKMAGR